MFHPCMPPAPAVKDFWSGKFFVSIGEAVITVSSLTVSNVKESFVLPAPSAILLLKESKVWTTGSVQIVSLAMYPLELRLELDVLQDVINRNLSICFLFQ